MAEKLIETGSNLTPETFLEVYREWRSTRREQENVGTAVARVGKKMKNVGINKQAFKIFEDLSQLDTDEAVIVLKTVIKYGSWAEKPFATQSDLFHGLAIDKPKDKAKQEFAEFEVEDAGYKSGKAGEPIDNNPYSPEDADDPRYALWRTGWHKGQEARVHQSFGGDAEAAGKTKSRGRKGRRNTSTDGEENPGSDSVH